jgi:hypothetical protein
MVIWVERFRRQGRHHSRAGPLAIDRPFTEAGKFTAKHADRRENPETCSLISVLGVFRGLTTAQTLDRERLKREA